MLCAQMELPTVHPPYGLLLPVPWMGNAVGSRTRGCSADTFVQCRHAQGRAGCPRVPTSDTGLAAERLQPLSLPAGCTTQGGVGGKPHSP